MSLTLTRGEPCPLCGKQYGPKRNRVEWVDAPAFYELIKPYIAFAGQGAHYSTRVNNVAVPYYDPDMQCIQSLKIGRKKKIKVSIAERMLTHFHLDPHLVDEILIQD